MLPDELDQLRYEILDASLAFKRIAKALGVERKIPYTQAGWDELAREVERQSDLRDNVIAAYGVWDELEGPFRLLVEAIEALRGPE